MSDNDSCECPRCGGSTFTRNFGGYIDYLWDEETSSFEEVDDEREYEMLCCSSCNSAVNEKETREQGKIILFEQEES